MVNREKVKEAVKLLLEAIGEDGSREGLRDTPERVAGMYEEILSGMGEKPSVHLSKTFEADNNNMVVERDIMFHSVCEHHLMPFFGRVHIAYIPAGKVVGLSKLARTVEVYARRLQIQERMTAQIADAIMECLEPAGVMVLVEAEHTCMTMRGVKKNGSQTVTMVARGAFEKEPQLQETFFRMTGR